MPDRRCVRTPNGEIFAETTDNGRAVKITISRGQHWMSIYLGPTRCDRLCAILDDLVSAIHEGDVEVVDSATSVAS